MAVNTNHYNTLQRVPYDKQMEAIIYMKRDLTPLLDMWNGSAIVTNASEVHWKRKDVLDRMYLENDWAADTTSTNPNIVRATAATQSGEPPYELSEGDLLLIGSEIMRVTAVPTITARSGTTNGYATLTVARGACGSTAAVHAAYTEVFIAGNARDIDADFSGANNNPGLGYVEYMTRSAVDSDLDTFASIINTNPGGGDAALDRYYKPIELAAKMEGQIIYGLQVAPSASTKFGTFTGLISAATTTGASYTAASFAQDEFEDVLEETENAGCNVDLIVCGTVVQKALNSWYQGQLYKSKVDGVNLPRIAQYLPGLRSNEKPVRIIRHKMLPSTHCLFLDSSQIQMHYLEKFNIEKMGADGSGPRHTYSAKWCMQVKKRGKHRKITDLTDYA